MVATPELSSMFCRRREPTTSPCRSNPPPPGAYCITSPTQSSDAAGGTQSPPCADRNSHRYRANAHSTSDGSEGHLTPVDGNEQGNRCHRWERAPPAIFAFFYDSISADVHFFSCPACATQKIARIGINFATPEKTQGRCLLMILSIADEDASESPEIIGSSTRQDWYWT